MSLDPMTLPIVTVCKLRVTLPIDAGWLGVWPTAKPRIQNRVFGSGGWARCR